MNVKAAKLLCLTVATLASASPIAAEQSTFQDALLDKLQGAWVITGTIAGEETTDDLTVEWVNQHQYLRLHEVSRHKRPNGRPRY
jgi:ethanolamine utilization microcompartment shell protein EutS